MSANGAADNFRASMNGVEDIKRKIIEHVALVEPEEVKAVRLELDQIAIDWEKQNRERIDLFHDRQARQIPVPERVGK